MATGGILLSIGYINDSSIGTFTYDESGIVKTTDAAFSNYDLEDIRKTDGTSYTLKLIGVITLATGALVQTGVMFMDSKPEAPEKI